MNPQRIGGLRITASAVQANVVEFLDAMMHDGSLGPTHMGVCGASFTCGALPRLRRPARLLRGTRRRTRGNGHDSTGHRRYPGLDRTSRRSQGPAVTYRAELSGRALKQMHGLPGPAFDSLIEVMAEVIDYPDDPLRTFLTSDLTSGASSSATRG